MKWYDAVTKNMSVSTFGNLIKLTKLQCTTKWVLPRDRVGPVMPQCDGWLIVGQPNDRFLVPCCSQWWILNENVSLVNHNCDITFHILIGVQPFIFWLGFITYHILIGLLRTELYSFVYSTQWNLRSPPSHEVTISSKGHDLFVMKCLLQGRNLK